MLNQLLCAGDRERNAAQKKQTAELKKATKRKGELAVKIDNIQIFYFAFLPFP